MSGMATCLIRYWELDVSGANMREFMNADVFNQDIGDWNKVRLRV